MIELEEGFSENDRYLINEYLKNGTDDFLLAGVGGKTFVVPYKYRKAAKDEVSAIEQFKSLLLDFQKAELNKYSDTGMAVRKVTFDGADYVVPFKAREKEISGENVAKYVAECAALKYDKVIDIYRELEKRGVKFGEVDFSAAALAKYQHRLQQICGKEKTKSAQTQILNKKTPEDKTANLTSARIVQKVGDLVKTAGRLVRKHSKVAGAAAVIGAGVAAAHFMPKGCDEPEAEPVQETPVTTVVQTNTGKYVDFRGVEHSDSLGNIARIMEMKAEISAMLIAVEGYAEKAYRDGKGVLTIGSGTTFYLDEHGNPQKVKSGDRLKPGEAMIHKWRFIEQAMLDLLGDKIGRVCSDKELMACIGAGFCWGANGLEKSEFYKAVCRGENKEIQSRKLTGYRKQKGLLKREYLLSACLLGKWSGRDLLEMPIYKYKGQYIGCSIYRLRLSEIMQCKTDKKGEFLKDKQGHHIPVIAADDFGTFLDNYDEIKHKLRNEAQYTFTSVKKVRDFMPEEMIEDINTRENNMNFISAIQNNAGVTR